ncbi:MAG TPA: hypothetical protein VMM92_14285 [Thermoanaerobaculia bacterium]|nr:hypothetical protein [Thermoanaerobaculia bacterium]
MESGQKNGWHLFQHLFQLQAVALAILGATVASAQQADLGMRFNFSTPGARSLAMGGAFIGLADDATAAYTNPAGLSNLMVGGPEVAIEARSWRLYNRNPVGGNDTGAPTGFGIDTVAGTAYGTSAVDTRGISFLSLGYVLPSGWTAALYRHEPVHFLNQYVNQGIFHTSSVQQPCWTPETPGNDQPLCREFPYRLNLRALVENYGVSVAHEILEPFGRSGEALSVGLGLSYYRFHSQARADFFLYDRDHDPLLNRLPGFLFGPADLLESSKLATASVDGTDSGVGINAGLLWKIGREGRWSLGAVYRQGAGFKVAGRATDALGHPLPAPESNVTSSLRLPDSWGVGAAYSLGRGETKLTLDLDQIRYSQRRSELPPRERASAQIDDGNEVHLGMERVVPIAESLIATLRLGGWYESAHELRQTSAGAPGAGGSSGGSYHWSGGLGLVVKEDYQIDVAADIAAGAHTLSLSLLRFL